MPILSQALFTATQRLVMGLGAYQSLDKRLDPKDRQELSTSDTLQIQNAAISAKKFLQKSMEDNELFHDARTKAIKLAKEGNKKPLLALIEIEQGVGIICTLQGYQLSSVHEEYQDKAHKNDTKTLKSDKNLMHTLLIEITELTIKLDETKASGIESRIAAKKKEFNKIVEEIAGRDRAYIYLHKIEEMWSNLKKAGPKVAKACLETIKNCVIVFQIITMIPLLISSMAYGLIAKPLLYGVAKPVWDTCCILSTWIGDDYIHLFNKILPRTFQIKYFGKEFDNYRYEKKHFEEGLLTSFSNAFYESLVSTVADILEWRDEMHKTHAGHGRSLTDTIAAANSFELYMAGQKFWFKVSGYYSVCAPAFAAAKVLIETVYLNEDMNLNNVLEKTTTALKNPEVSSQMYTAGKYVAKKTSDNEKARQLVNDGYMAVDKVAKESSKLAGNAVQKAHDTIKRNIPNNPFRKKI